MIEIKEITKIYSNNKGIKDASFVVENGTICGIVGSNGAGKSTLIKSIFGEINRDSGTVLYNNQDIYKFKLLNKFSLFPDQSVFPKSISLLDFTIYAATLAGMKFKQAKAQALKIISSVNLSDYLNKTFKDLSAGMQKRALLAICLINSPEVLILDEPTANLDVKTRVQFLDLLIELKNMGKTILISSHLIDELQSIINQVVIIENGRIIFDKKVTSKTNLKKIYNDNVKSEEIININQLKESQGGN